MGRRNSLTWFLWGATAVAAPLRGAQTPPWSEIEPLLQRARWVVVAEVQAVDYLPRIGSRVQARVKERLAGDAGCPDLFAYLHGSGAVVEAGDRELLLLQPPEPGGFHLLLLAKFGQRSPYAAAREEWLRAVLRMRALEKKSQGPAFVGYYAEQLASPVEWTRERALQELERLRRLRETELRALLAPAALEKARAACGEGPARKRLEALIEWRNQAQVQAERP